MPPIRSIAVLFHERDRHPDRAYYRIWALAANWEARGISVEPIWGIRRESRADLLIPHLDVSYIPDDYWAFIQRHPNVVNRAVRDIRKTRFSTARVGSGDAVEGPVIVKTVGNCGGFVDDWLHAPDAGPGRRLLRRIARIPWVERRSLRLARSLTRYPVFESMRDVPRGVFRNPHLLVERFVPERRGEEYLLRLWTVFGSGAVGRIVVSREPIVKAWNGRLADRIGAPPEILWWRERLGLDYGKMDYTVHEGKPVLLDVNTTPTMSNPPLEKESIERTVVLADGLAHFEAAAR